MKAFLLVVLLVAATVSAQYYNYQGEPYQPPFVHAQPTVHYQPFNHFQPVNPDGQWQILRDNRHQSPSGEYAYEYETQNGIIANEQSYIASPNQAQRKTGFFQYPSPDGRTIRVDYVADENGFQATGDHLPKSPKIPDPIASSIEYNLKQADRQYLQEAYAAQGY